VNKSDRNDARGIAQMMRVNLFRPVHVKTLTSQKRRALLTARKILQDKAIAIENDIRGLLRNFGLKVGVVGLGKFDERIRMLVEGMPELVEIMEPLLAARQKLRETFATLHRKLLSIVRDDGVCRRLMTIPGVGPVVSLAFSATIDIPARFKNSRAVGPSLGLTPVLNQSGEESPDRSRLAVWGRHDVIASLRSRAGHDDPRAEMVIAEGVGDERRQASGLKKAIVALARRLAVIMHRIWADGSVFRWTNKTAPGLA
jgi:transposase